MGFLKRLQRLTSHPAEGSPTAPRTFPPAMVAEAKANPNGWVYEIEGSFGPNDAVPPQAIRGAWKVGPTGELTGEYEANPNFRTSPETRDIERG